MACIEYLESWITLAFEFKMMTTWQITMGTEKCKIEELNEDALRFVVDEGSDVRRNRLFPRHRLRVDRVQQIDVHDAMAFDDRIDPQKLFGGSRWIRDSDQSQQECFILVVQTKFGAVVRRSPGNLSQKLLSLLNDRAFEFVHSALEWADHLDLILVGVSRIGIDIDEVLFLQRVEPNLDVAKCIQHSIGATK